MDERYSLTHDYYSLYLWCNEHDASEIATFFGSPESLDAINKVRDEHEATHHAAVPSGTDEASGGE